MAITRQSLSEQFQRLNDNALIALVRSRGLTEFAREVAAAELQRRGIALSTSVETKLQDTVPGPISDDLVPVAQSFSVQEAYMLQSRLEIEGVPAVVADANMMQTLSLLSIAIGGVRVLVPESYLERAREIAAAVARGDYALGDETDVG